MSIRDLREKFFAAHVCGCCNAPWPLLSSIVEHIGRLETSTVDSVTVADTKTVAPGQPAYVVNQGTAKNVKLEFGIPEGIPGVNSVEVGETLTLEPGSDAYVRNVGDYDHLNLEFGIPAGVKGDTGPQGPQGDAAPAELVVPAVNAWLTAHPEATTTVQDGSITDAKLVQTGGVLEEVHDIRTGANGIEYPLAGDAVRSNDNRLFNLIHSFAEYEPQSSNLLNVGSFEDGFYSGGVWTSSTTYVTSEYIYVRDFENVYINMWNLNNNETKQNTSKFFNYIYWFDVSGAYIGRSDFVTGTVQYAVPSNAFYGRIMATKSVLNNRLAENKAFSVSSPDMNTWIPYSSEKFVIEKDKNTFSFNQTLNSFEIKTPKARYIFKKVTNANENLDSWRLYQGDLIDSNGNYQNMWTDSDAEGAVKILGENDFVSGFHGSERSTDIHVFLDAVELDLSQIIPATEFKTLDFYVTSNVYHNYESQQASDVAFIRHKILSFSGNKVAISNNYTLQEDLTIARASIALFNLYKYNSDNEQMTMYYSTNYDYSLSSVPVVSGDTSIYDKSEHTTDATIDNIYARISVRSLQTSGQNYRGYVQDFYSSKRIKVYFNTVDTNFAMRSGEVLSSKFEFEIG